MVTSVILLVNLGPCVSLASIAQLMELLYLVNITNTPYSYFGYANAMSMVTFSFLPNLPLLILPSRVTMDLTPENAVDPPFSYNRYFKGKAFITNIGNVITFYLMIGIYSVVCLLLKSKVKYFEEKSKGLSNILIQSTVVNFNQIMITGFFQFAYVVY